MEDWTSLLIFLTFGFTVSLCAMSASDGYFCENSKCANLENRICKNYLLWTVTGIRHSQCLLKCLSDNQICQAVFYNAITGKCQGHSSILTSEDNCTAEDGAKYYHKCTDKPCLSSPPIVQHASAVVSKVNNAQKVAVYTCNPGYMYAGGENNIRCDHDYGQWGEATFRCTECFNDLTYNGTKSKTQDGIECQRWDSQSPHNHVYTEPDMFPEKSVTAAENFCRTFDHDQVNAPWCYTTYLYLRWDYCGIPKCYRALENNCGPPSLLTIEYANEIQYLNYTNYGAMASYKCNTFSDLTLVEYCPVSVCTKFGWSVASISCGVQDRVSNSSIYCGKRTCTVSGLTCQRWNSEYPHSHKYTNATFPDGSATDAGNYCRDPSGYGTTWCYTMDPNVSWEVCDVLSCD